MRIDSLYTPACTTTDGIALFCAAAMARLIAVNCAEPSRATVTAVGLDVAEDAEVDNAVQEEPEVVVAEGAEVGDAVDGRLEAVSEGTDDEIADPDVADRDDDELDSLTIEADILDEESDWAAARPTSPTRAARNCMVSIVQRIRGFRQPNETNNET